jgi:hypothetical protein
MVHTHLTACFKLFASDVDFRGRDARFSTEVFIFIFRFLSLSLLSHTHHTHLQHIHNTRTREWYEKVGFVKRPEISHQRFLETAERALLDGPLSAFNQSTELTRSLVLLFGNGLYTAQTTVRGSDGKRLKMRGLFCLFDLPPNVVIGLYLGTIVTEKEYERYRDARVSAAGGNGAAALASFLMYGFGYTDQSGVSQVVDPALGLDPSSSPEDFASRPLCPTAFPSPIAFANEASQGTQANVLVPPFGHYHPDHVVYLTGRGIKAHAEIFVHYGVGPSDYLRVGYTPGEPCQLDRLYLNTHATHILDEYKQWQAREAKVGAFVLFFCGSLYFFPLLQCLLFWGLVSFFRP